MTTKRTIKDNIRRYLRHWCNELSHWNLGDERNDLEKKDEREKYLEL